MTSRSWWSTRLPFLARLLIFPALMAPTKILLAIALGASGALVGPAPAHGAESRHCDDKLIELGSMQAALTQMEAAVADNVEHQQRLRTEASTLAATIAEKLRDGASETEVQPLVEQREAALTELDEVAAIQPVFERQLEALVLEVDTAERSYIACVESTLE